MTGHWVLPAVQRVRGRADVRRSGTTGMSGRRAHGVRGESAAAVVARMSIPGLGLVGADGPRIAPAPGSIEEAMRAEVERPRPRPQESDGVRRRCMRGAGPGPRSCRPGSPSRFRCLTRAPRRTGSIWSRRTWTTRSSRPTSSVVCSVTCGRPRRRAIRAAGCSRGSTRPAGRCGSTGGTTRCPTGGTTRSSRASTYTVWSAACYDRGPEWQPSYLEKLYTTAR